MSNDDESVRYSVKELLQDIRDEMRHMMSLIESKADRSDITRLDGRISDAEVRIDSVEAHVDYQRKTAAEQSSRRVWLWPTVATVMVVIATVGSIIADVIR